MSLQILKCSGFKVLQLKTLFFYNTEFHYCAVLSEYVVTSPSTVNDLSQHHQWSVDEEEALKQQATNTQGYDATSLNNRVINS
jgi:hypothetical protein